MTVPVGVGLPVTPVTVLVPVMLLPGATLVGTMLSEFWEGRAIEAFVTMSVKVTDCEDA